MELKLNDNFCEMTQEEAMNTDGGIGWAGVVLVIILLLAVASSLDGCSAAERDANAAK